MTPVLMPALMPIVVSAQENDWIAVRVDGRAVAVARGTLVAAALEIDASARGARVSPGGARRQAFCGMGVCGECRVAVDGQAHRLGCHVVCVAGMEIRTDA